MNVQLAATTVARILFIFDIKESIPLRSGPSKYELSNSENRNNSNCPLPKK
jgi:hypothetical protein